MTIAGQVGRMATGSFQETAPRKTAEKTVRFDGSQPLRCRGESSVVVTTVHYYFWQHRHRRLADADVPAGSDVTDFWCPMCTSAEPYPL